MLLLANGVRVGCCPSTTGGHLKLPDKITNPTSSQLLLGTASPSSLKIHAPSNGSDHESEPETIHTINIVTEIGSEPKMDRFEAIYSNTPPAPPPKPGSHDVSRMSTPINTQSPGPSPHPDQQQHSDLPEPAGVPVSQQAQATRPQAIQDPGDQWLPQFLEDKSCVAPTTLSMEIRATAF